MPESQIERPHSYVAAIFSLSSLPKPKDEDRSETILREEWREALKAGKDRKVRGLMRRHKIDADFPANIKGDHPLKIIALSDEDPSKFDHQVRTAKTLIERGCELTVPDSRFMLPADYAMMSANTTLAAMIAVKTILELSEGNRALGYTPNMDGWLKTHDDTEERLRRMGNFVRNCNTVGDVVMNQNFLAESPKLFAALSIEDMHYWSETKKMPPEADIPSPSKQSAGLRFLREIAVIEDKAALRFLEGNKQSFNYMTQDRGCGNIVRAERAYLKRALGEVLAMRREERDPSPAPQSEERPPHIFSKALGRPQPFLYKL
ncbi:MAG: hypothetical protein DI551_03385 [Micavibrio aeruginosavorus]|uniref:Uncharacterized protein n=1 Tax=Micavibrio aeruginosavorus TaxID=349221 RepID=A0A2W5N454_9BACT|nr:MAG: hypothetical protein DI551_03385 [Micavibrio aeruginosavorus]